MYHYYLKEFGSIDYLCRQQENIAPPIQGEIMIRVYASSLNYRDLALVKGQYTLPCQPGHIPLSDGAGEVIVVGEGVTRFKVGDRVAGIFFPRWHGGTLAKEYFNHLYGSESNGWLTQYKCVNEEALVLIPDYLSYEEAATLPCAAVTAWHALRGPQPIKAGDCVLTLGTGGVALFAVQLAKLMGARVIALTSSPAKAKQLQQMGADTVINYQEIPNWHTAVLALTNGGGVHRVIEVGGSGTLEQSLLSIAIGGEIALIGFIAKESSQLDFSTLFNARAILRRVDVGSREHFDQLNYALKQHHLRPVIDRIFSFQDAKEAWQYFSNRQHVGKVVISHV